MIGYILGGIGAVVLILLAVIIIRTLAFRPEKLPEIKAEPLTFNKDKIVNMDDVTAIEKVIEENNA